MRSSFCEVDPVIKWRACLFLNSVEEAGMAFPDGGWLLSRFEWVFACSHPPPPGMLYDPNRVDEQNEQHKLLPKRI